MPRGVSLLWCAAAALLALSGCRPGEEGRRAEQAPPQAIEGVVKLSEAAQKTAGLVSVKVARQAVRDSLEITGWLAAVPGREVVVRAPLAGIVRPGLRQAGPRPGDAAAAREPLASLDVFLSPQDRAQLASATAQLASSSAEAEQAAKQAQVAARFAQAQLNRLKSAPGTVPASRIADLEEALERSAVAYEEAEKKRHALSEAQPDASRSTATMPLSVPSPISGRVTASHVAAGQHVAAGDPLWTVADWSSLWVRVPVFEGDLGRIDPVAQVRVAAPDSHESVLATPIQVPRSAAVGQRTVELVYGMENPAGRYYPGQAVTATLYLGSKAERVIVPASAVLWEGANRAYCYVKAGDDSFVQRRLELGPPSGDGFVVERGLSEGEEVVAVGAEALRGEEFKGTIPAGED